MLKTVLKLTGKGEAEGEKITSHPNKFQVEPWVEEESEEHSRRSQRCSRGAGIMFLANILSINSANIHRTHIGSQMDVGTGAGRRGAKVP